MKIFFNPISYIKKHNDVNPYSEKQVLIHNMLSTKCQHSFKKYILYNITGQNYPNFGQSRSESIRNPKESAKKFVTYVQK